jgi:hypothetical protein
VVSLLTSLLEANFEIGVKIKMHEIFPMHNAWENRRFFGIEPELFILGAFWREFLLEIVWKIREEFGRIYKLSREFLSWKDKLLSY